MTEPRPGASVPPDLNLARELLRASQCQVKTSLELLQAVADGRDSAAALQRLRDELTSTQQVLAEEPRATGGSPAN